MREKFYLGIDVGKNEHQATLIDADKKIIGKSIRFENNRSSFENLIAQLKDSMPEQTFNGKEIAAGMESTGHYWYNLQTFFQSKGLVNISIINPIETQQLSKKRIRKVKNDKVDSLTIARLIADKKNSDVEAVEENKNNNCEERPFVKKEMPADYEEKIKKLKKITRFWDKLGRQEKFYKKEIIGLLEVICPEFEKMFSNIFLETPMGIIEKYNDLTELKKEDEKEFIDLVKKKSRGRIKEERGKKILEGIKNSIGIENNDEYSGMQLKMLIESLKLILRQKEEVEKKIKEMSDKFESKKVIATIIGVSEKIAAVAIAEIGDVNRFENADKLTAFAGLDASVYESGDFKRKQGNRISKRGSKYLRKQLYYAAKVAVVFDPELKKYYERKKAEGKHYNVIVIAVARKILHRIYRVWKDNRAYEVRG